MASADNRFEGYNPAPMNHSMVDRGLRVGAGAVSGGASGAVLGGVFGPVLLGAIGAGILIASGAGLASILLGAAAGGVLGAMVATPLGAVLGGIFGAVRGGSREHSRAMLDQSLYNLQMNVLQAQQPPIYVQPQPANGPVASMVTAPHHDAAGADATRMDTKVNEASAKIPAASSIQHDGMMIDANRALARL